MRYSNPNNKPMKQGEYGTYPEDYFTSRPMSTYEVEKIIAHKTQGNSDGCFLFLLVMGLCGAIAFSAAKVDERLRKLEQAQPTPAPTPAVLFRLGPSAAPVGEEAESAPMA